MVTLTTVFSVKRKLPEQNIWVTTLMFYHGCLTQIDTAVDDRFRPIEGKREEAKTLGMCYTDFPVTFPLKLTNGIVLQEQDYYITPKYTDF